MGFQSMMGTAGEADGIGSDPSTVTWYPPSSSSNSYCYVSNSNSSTSSVIRHVHGIFIDLNDTLWALTGDLGYQAAFWTWSASSSAWVRMTPAEPNIVLSQQWRALSMQERKQTLYWGTDTGGKTPGRIMSATASQLSSCAAGSYCSSVTTVANLPTGGWFSAKTANNIIVFGGVVEGQTANSTYYQPGGTIELHSNSNLFNPNDTPLSSQSPDAAAGPMGYGQCATTSLNAATSIGGPTNQDNAGAVFTPATVPGSCTSTDGGVNATAGQFECRCYEQDVTARVWSIDQNNKVTQIWSGSPSSLVGQFGKVNTFDTDPTGHYLMFAPLNLCYPGSSCLNQITTTGNLASGSTTIGGVASTSGIAAGWYITGTGIPDNTLVTGISGSSITMSNAATATRAATTLYFNQTASFMNVGSFSISH